MIKDFEAFVKSNYLKELDEQKKYNYPTDFERSFDNFLEVNNVNENTVTDDMIDWYSYHICDKDGYFNPNGDDCDCPNFNTYVNEMLQKTSLELLKNRLNSELGGDENNFVVNSTDFDDKVNILLVSKEIYNRDKIFKICDKMMWSFSSVEYKKNYWRNPEKVDDPYVFTDYGMDVIRIKVEPIKTKNITEFIKNNCKGKIYHICSMMNLNRILKSGLRVKGENNDYRYIKNKVFFVCGENKKDILKNISTVAKSKYAWDSDENWITDEFVLLEIDVNGYNIDFYQDGYYNEGSKYIGYTFNYIPPKRIKEVDEDDIK